MKNGALSCRAIAQLGCHNRVITRLIIKASPNKDSQCLEHLKQHLSVKIEMSLYDAPVSPVYLQYGTSSPPISVPRAPRPAKLRDEAGPGVCSGTTRGDLPDL